MEYWKYTEGSKIKHLFYAPNRSTSVCGVGRRWFDPEDWKWDKKGLETKRECKKCIKFW